MSTRDKTDSPQNLQHSHFGLDVLRAQTLWDGVDALRMGQDMSTALGVVHQSFDATDDRRVHATLGRLVVHASQEVQEAGEPIKLDEASYKPKDTQE